MKIAYCRKPDEPEYMEQLLTEVEARIPMAAEWAKRNGMIVRIAEYNGERPDFVRAVLA